MKSRLKTQTVLRLVEKNITMLGLRLNWECSPNMKNISRIKENTTAVH